MSEQTPPLPPRIAPAEPQITVLPHLSAPIDEGPLLPKEPWRLRDKLVVGALLMAFALLVLGWAFYHASALA